MDLLHFLYNNFGYTTKRLLHFYLTIKNKFLLPRLFLYVKCTCHLPLCTFYSELSTQHFPTEFGQEEAGGRIVDDDAPTQGAAIAAERDDVAVGDA